MPVLYAGVGSRRTPHHIFDIMVRVGKKLAKTNYVLRSGGASGADTAFAFGCSEVQGLKEIFYADDATPAARQELEKHLEPSHLAALRRGGWLDLHARNCMQVLGQNLNTPVKFVLCWTSDGATTKQECTKATGGTGTAIKIANHYNIPVFNLQKADHLKRIQTWLNKD